MSEPPSQNHGARPPTGAECRSGPLYDQVASVIVLSKAWDRVRENEGAAGSDGLTVSRFAQSAEQRIRRLAHDLRTGRYVPAPARRVYIPKTSGGVRPLDIPCVTDRVVQAAAAMVLDPILDAEMAPSSFAYRKGRSVAGAVARVASHRRDGFRYVVDGDIRAYFESIPHEPLILRLERHVDDLALVDLVWTWLETYAPTGRGVPQGSPISPLLANLYLDDVDDAIEGRGVRIVRFADDFVLLCKSEDTAEGALAEMSRLLGKHGLEIHPDKTRIVDFDRGFRFLGHVFVRSMVWKEVSEDDTPKEDAIAAAEVAVALMERQAEPEFDPDVVEDSGLAPRLRPLYLLEPGRRLAARGNTLLVMEDETEVLAVPPSRLGRIELGPECEASLTALDLCLANGVEVARIDAYGGVVARYEGQSDDRARRQLAQAATALDAERRLALARILVDGRIRNQRALLRRLNRQRAIDAVAETAVRLGRVLRKLPAATSVEQAMGHEGEAGALYWPALGLALPEDLQLKARQRKPAPDPANAVISTMSSLLARDVRAMAQRAGLHVGFGVLHATTDGEDALVYDLVEEFRAPIAEAAALALFNRRALRREMFMFDGQAVRMGRDAWKAAIRGYEAWVQRPIKSPRSGKNVLWRGVMLEQAHAYAVHCEGRETYKPYKMDY